MDRAAFLAERRTGIGSSDAASLMNVGYGCKRRLWYDKVGVPADYEREQNDAMELGQILEPFFIRKFEKATKKAVHPTGQAPAFRHPKYPFLLSHPDGIMGIGGERIMGTLEVKSMDRGAFFKTKREGLMEDYILQKQWTMLVIGNSVGDYAVGNRGSGELLHWEVTKNEPLQEMLLAEGVAFWKTVEMSRADLSSEESAANMYAPPRLPPDDPRCHGCEWRDTCQGNALMEISSKDDGGVVQAPELFPLYTEYKERVELVRQAEDLLEETKEELKTIIGDRTRLSVNGRRIYYAPQVSNRWDGEELFQYSETLRSKLRSAMQIGDAEFDRMFPKMEKKPSMSRPLRVF